MHVRRFETVEAFLDHVTPFLVAREAEHNRILGICNNMAQGAAYFPGPNYFVTIEQDDHILGVAMRTPPYQLHLSMMDPACIPALAADVLEAYADLPAVVGEVSLSQAFAGEWTRLTGQGSHVGIATRVFQLTAVQPVEEASGSFRRAQETDRALLIEWLSAFNEEALGHSISHHDRQHIEAEIALDLRGGPRGMYVWEDEDQVVSMAAYTGPTPNGIRVVHVYTPPGLRGRGYATTCVAALSQKLLEGGRKFVFLFTDLSNPTSNHIYQEIGYQPVCDITEHVFE